MSEQRSRKFGGPTARACLACLMLVAAANIAAAKDTLVLLDGKRIEAEVKTIEAATGRVTADGLEQPLELQGLRSLNRPAQEIKREAGAFSLRLAGGGEMLASSLKVADEKVAVTTAYGDAALSLEAVRAVVFASDNKAADRPEVSDQGKELLAAALAQPPGEKDSLLVVVEGKVQTLSGLVSEWKAL